MSDALQALPIVSALAVVSALLVLVLVVAALSALRQGRFGGSFTRLLLAAFFGAVLTASLALILGVRGYQTLTREIVAAVVTVEPKGYQRFIARFEMADGSEATYALAGDELYVDARIVKWKYWANLLGLHTSYEFDRVAGRYRSIEDEQTKPRTVESLVPERPVDLFQWRRPVNEDSRWKRLRFEALAPIYDAEFGSATFIPADQPARYEIRVSTTGLLARPAGSAREGFDSESP